MNQPVLTWIAVAAATAYIGWEFLSRLRLWLLKARIEVVETLGSFARRNFHKLDADADGCITVSDLYASISGRGVLDSEVDVVLQLRTNLRSIGKAVAVKECTAPFRFLAPVWPRQRKIYGAQWQDFINHETKLRAKYKKLAGQ